MHGLWGRRVLLILDNFEQVLGAAGDLPELLARAESLQLLVTSRAALGLHDESEYPLEPLPLPARGKPLEDSPAVALFVHRARAVQPEFTLSDENARDVVALVKALEGVPLAIELAAARLRSFTLRDLRSRLDHPLAFLKADFRDRPERLRSLRAAVQWSYDLLSQEDREVLECCALFKGSFTPEALVVVWGGPDVLDRAEALLEQSFLQRVSGPATRWKMLQPLRSLLWSTWLQAAAPTPGASGTRGTTFRCCHSPAMERRARPRTSASGTSRITSICAPVWSGRSTISRLNCHCGISGHPPDLGSLRLLSGRSATVPARSGTPGGPAQASAAQSAAHHDGMPASHRRHRSLHQLRAGAAGGELGAEKRTAGVVRSPGAGHW
ncbi:ATP-binding protein [Deinococcus malanensis]|uniref:ATP-binding protein n=1 Tax=Deinococcus malanensis TaxID=1706855 RepID=UPI00362FE4AD